MSKYIDLIACTLLLGLLVYAIAQAIPFAIKQSNTNERTQSMEVLK